jgi:hypothetical protein
MFIWKREFVETFLRGFGLSQVVKFASIESRHVLSLVLQTSQQIEFTNDRYLMGNDFEGELPPEIFNMPGLQSL